MIDDYKYQLQLLAEDMAYEQYNEDFYDLSDDQQYQVYRQAEDIFRQRWLDSADQRRKEEQENGR